MVAKSNLKELLLSRHECDIKPYVWQLESGKEQQRHISKGLSLSIVIC